MRARAAPGREKTLVVLASDALIVNRACRRACGDYFPVIQSRPRRRAKATQGSGMTQRLPTVLVLRVFVRRLLPMFSLLPFRPILSFSTSSGSDQALQTFMQKHSIRLANICPYLPKKMDLLGPSTKIESPIMATSRAQ